MAYNPEHFASITPAGTTTTDATVMAAKHVYAMIVAAGAGIRLQPGNADDEYTVENGDATNALKVYPPTGGRFNFGSTDAAISIRPNSTAIIFCHNATNYHASYAQDPFTGPVTSPKFLTSTNVGVVTTAATTVAEEHGDGVNHVTKLTLTAFAVGTSGDNASLGIGAEVYTFPAGCVVVENTSIAGGLTAAISNTAQTPVIGLGTVIATGAVSVLSGTATFQDLFAGAAVADVAGTLFEGVSAITAPVLLKTSGGKAHKLFLNTAVAWADVVAAGAVTFTGVITVRWRLVS